MRAFWSIAVLALALAPSEADAAVPTEGASTASSAVLMFELDEGGFAYACHSYEAMPVFLVDVVHKTIVNPLPAKPLSIPEGCAVVTGPFVVRVIGFESPPHSWYFSQEKETLFCFTPMQVISSSGAEPYFMHTNVIWGAPMTLEGANAILRGETVSPCDE